MKRRDKCHTNGNLLLLCNYIRRELVHESATGAQELWLACSSLQRALEAERPESGLLPLKDEVEAIKTALQKQSVKSDDAFVDAVVDSLPNEALVRGNKVLCIANNHEKMKNLHITLLFGRLEKNISPKNYQL